MTAEEESMKNCKRWLGLVMIACCITGCSGVVAVQEEAAPTKEAQQAEAKSIDAIAEVDNNHPAIEPGLSCNDCHEIKLDANTTATQLWLSGEWGAKKAGEGVMPKDQLWQEIVKVIGGIKMDSKTYVLATSMNNIPLTTTAEFTLDPAKKVLYGFHEQGTEKLLHIKNNPQVSLNWHKEFVGFGGDYLCFQIRGRAELIDGTSPDYEQILIDFLPYEDGARVPKDATPKQREEHLAKFRQGIKNGFYISKITIDRVTVISLDFGKQGFRRVQRWER